MAYYRKLKNGKWSFTVDVGRDPLTGKRKQVTRSGFAKKSEAELAALAAKKDFKNPTSLTFEGLYKLWVESSDVKESTASQRDYMVKAHILPYFKKKKLNKITPMDCERFIMALREKGLKSSSVFVIRSYVSSIMNKAVNIELIEKNPMTRVKVKQEKAKKAAWTVQESMAFLEYCKDYSLYWIAYYLALHAGLRIGEICVLKWTDITEDSIFITKTASQREGKWYIDKPKTPTSNRIVPLNSLLGQALAEWKTDSEWLFPGRNEFTVPNTIRKDFYRLIDETGLPRIGFHDLRATHITMLLDAGVPVHIVSKRVGHADISETLNTYSRVHDEQLRKSSSTIDDLFSGK